MSRFKTNWIISACDLKTYEHKFYRFDGLTYRESISFNAFFYGRKKYNWNKDKVLYTSIHPYDLEALEKLINNYPECKEGLAKTAIENDTATHCLSLFDFYEKIGFDRKTKKYI